MLIDWFTVAAQVINFLILVGLLRWLLYKRVIQAMDQREQSIANRAAEAKQKLEEAEEKAKDYDHKREKIEQEREVALKQAQNDAKNRRSDLIKAAREEVQALRQEWFEGLRDEKESFLQELRDRAGREIVALTRQTIEEMADSSLEDQMATELLRRLHQLDEEKQRDVADAIRHAEGQVTLRSAFILPDETVIRVSTALDEIYRRDLDVDPNPLTLDRKVESDLICGIEVEAGGCKIGWSIEDQLTQLEEDFDHLIEGKSHHKVHSVKSSKTDAPSESAQSTVPSKINQDHPALDPTPKNFPDES